MKFITTSKGISSSLTLPEERFTRRYFLSFNFILHNSSKFSCKFEILQLTPQDDVIRNLPDLPLTKGKDDYIIDGDQEKVRSRKLSGNFKREESLCRAPFLLFLVPATTSLSPDHRKWHQQPGNHW